MRLCVYSGQDITGTVNGLGGTADSKLRSTQANRNALGIANQLSGTVGDILDPGLALVPRRPYPKPSIS